MPNHISNRMWLSSLNEDDWKKEEDALEVVKALMKTDDSPFDFNVLIPYPQEYQVLDDVRRKLETEVGLRAAMSVKDGYNSGGYEWCIHHWGTKWNAYNISFDHEATRFQTAWSTPLPIWVELSKRFPDLYLKVEYADEDRGSNCGTLTYLNGELVAFDDMSKRPEAKLFARAILAEQGEAENWTEVLRLKAELAALTAVPSVNDDSAADAK